MPVYLLFFKIFFIFCYEIGLIVQTTTEVSQILCFISLFCAIKYEARLEDGTTVSKSGDAEFIVKEGFW